MFFKQRLLKVFCIKNGTSYLQIQAELNSIHYFFLFDHQFYLDIVKVKNFRVDIISKLRASSHRLEIEIEGWARPNRVPDGRKCGECNKLEDEFHLLLECSLYNDLRKQYPIKRRVTKSKCIRI